MYAREFDVQENKSLPAVPADHKVIAQRRPGEGMLADEAFNARPSLGTTYAEAALMCAVLEDAVDCFQKQSSRTTARAKQLGREAERWLFSDDPSWPFSFVSICNVLELCPQYIRQGLKRWHSRDQESPQSKIARTDGGGAADGRSESKLESEPPAREPSMWIPEKII